MKTLWGQVCLTLVCMAFAGRAKAVVLNVSGDAEASDMFGRALAVGDFDCDGDDDLVVGVVGEDSGGGINLVYSGSSGLAAAGSHLFKFGHFAEHTGDEGLGVALAAGDFDGDGCDDIAAGAPGVQVGGAVLIAYGGSGGIDPINSELWQQDSTGIGEVGEPGDFFGLTVTSADFDGDGFDDVAVGSPFEDLGSLISAGVVNVLYGSASGITAAGDQVFHQNTSGVRGTAESDDNFAYVMTSGDFNGDGFGDLAVGSPADPVDGLRHAGSVLILPGSAGGLNVDADQLLVRKDLGFPNETVLFGNGLAVGDFNGDGMDDLGVGAPSAQGSGAVHVLYGSTSGLPLSASQLWTQDSSGVPGSSSSGDYFGLYLTAGNFNGGSYDDLAIANPKEVVNGVDDAGAVTILYGSSSRLKTQTSFTNFITQNTTTDDPAETDQFGSGLASGDFNSDGRDELLVSVYFETLSDKASAGAAHVYYGSGSGPKADSTSQFLRQ